MKRFVSLFLMLILLFTSFTALAEDDGSISPAAYIEEPTIEPNATRRILVTGSAQILYTCPVRKTDIYVTFHNSELFTSVQIKLQTLTESGSWTDASGWLSLQLGSTRPFNLSQSARYRVLVIKEQSYYMDDAYCTFYVEASPSP